MRAAFDCPLSARLWGLEAAALPPHGYLERPGLRKPPEDLSAFYPMEVGLKKSRELMG